MLKPIITNKGYFSAIEVIDLLSSSLEIEDLTLLSDERFSVGVPYNYPEQFMKYIFAAGKAYFLGNTVNYVLKNYSDAWDFKAELSHPTIQLLNAIIDSTKRKLRESCDQIDKKLHTNTPALIASSAALTRLIMTFRAAILLIRNGFLFESALMCRLILEQLSWAYAIHDSRDNDFLKVLPTASISKTKKLIPYVAKLYGVLSKFSHISPEITSDYIIRIKAAGGPYVLLKSPRSILYACYLLILADAFATVGDAIVKFSPWELNTNKSLNHNIKPSPQGSAFEFLQKHQKEIEALIHDDLQPLLKILST